jgi:hypothetical protein
MVALVSGPMRNRLAYDLPTRIRTGFITDKNLDRRMQEKELELLFLVIPSGQLPQSTDSVLSPGF